MGFLTRLLAGLTAAAALGAGLTGTANAVDVTGATGTTKSVVKLTADDTNNLPDHIVNGSFDYPSVPSWTGLAGSSSNKNNKGKRFATINPGTGKYGSGCAMSTTGRAIPNWNRSSFAWNSTQGDAHYPGMSCEAGNVELNYDSVHHNQFAELTADQQGTAIYQDVKVTPGTMMTWSLKHSSATSAYVDKMQVMIGEPYKETAQEATRIASENGNKVGEKMTTISTPTTSDRADNKKWDTYSGTYLVPDGVTTVRFTFKSVASAEWYSGNDLDDIEFSRSYKLTYDKNSADASGQVPSNQRGKENTTQPAKTKTSGTVRTVADTNSSLPDHLVNGDFEYPGVNVLSKNRYDEKDNNWWGVSRKDRMVYDPSHEIQWVSLPSTFDSDRFAWDSTEVAGTQNGSSQWHTNEVELQRDSHTGNMYGELCAYQAHTSIRQYIRTTPGALYKVRLKHASLSSEYLDKMQVLVGPAGNEQPVSMTRVESQNGLDATGQSTTSTTVSTHASNEMEIKDGQGTPYSSRNHDGQWATYEGIYVATSDVTSFTFKSVDAKAFNLGNLLDDIVFDKAYKLTYDANSSDASGQVPSNQRGKENTTQPAKTKTSGIVKTVADDTLNLPDHLVNGDFSVNYKDQWLTGGWNWTSITPDGKYLNSVRNWNDSATTWKTVNGWDKTKFGWSSTQKDGTDNIQHKAGAVEIQYDDLADNVYAELCAYEAGTAIYQDIKTVPGTLYKVRLKHASLYDGYLDKMQVMIGAPGHEQPVEMTRTGVNGNGDKLNEKSNIIATKVSNTGENDRNHDSQWESYEGTYPIPAGQTVTRFTFRSVGSRNLDHGNLLDDIVFDKAYRLSYDKNASDATGKVPSNQRGKENAVEPAESKTTGNVKTVADNTSNLPDHLVNGTFDYRGNEIINENQRVYGRHDTTYLAIISAKTGVIGNPLHSKLDNWDPGQFGWSSNDDTNGAATVEVQRRNHTPYPTDAGNVWGEIAAAKRGRYIYQDIATTPGVMYKWSLKHASRNAGQDDSMQVKIGEPGKTVAQQATRTTSNGSDKTGSVGTTITTHGTAQDGKWETYTGTYIATSTVTRFTFRSVRDSNGQGLDFTAEGNCVDDLSFDKAYKLSYDKNATDANGSVPSSQYGKENTVQPAKAKTAETVRTVADKTASGLTVHDLKNGEIAPVQYGDFKFSTVNGFSADQVTNVNGFTVKTNWDPCEENQAYAGVLATMYQPNGNGANLILHHVGQWRDSSGTQRWLNARITVNGQNLGSLVYYESQHKFLASYGKWDRHTSSRPYMDVTVDFLLDDGSTPQGLRGATGFTDLNGGTSGYNEGVELVSGFDGAYVRSDAHLARFGTNGWAGATDENENDADAHGMKHYVGATFTGSSFRVRWSVASGQARGSGFQPVDSTIAYRLTYNKNAQDATGSIPSDTAADTIRPAKSETDGKVSDLVQRTTTHEDGSVTVRTIDTSMDVVSGCQVYYPAGQKITLATMAKDDDCWDSSMLSRPGHTQLGWNQDPQATQAQAQVTMVEGGMTVYAVWVGNPVLTYDTNKPSTWTGEMPSTPASVSVPYNTAAADGSGWRAGDTTKIRGYRFLGWYTAPQDNAGLYDWTRPLTGSVTVYAHWQRLQANVIYNANGGTGSHANTTGWQYSDVTIPGDTSKSFTRTGYRFSGWNTAKDGKGTAYKDGSQVPLQAGDVTLYAQWTPLFDVLPSAGGDYGPTVPWLVCGGLALIALAGGVASTLLRLRRARGAHSR